VAQDFQQYYERELRPLLEDLEGRRRAAWAAFRRSLTVIVVLALLGAAAAFAFGFPLVAVIALVLGVGAVIIAWQVHFFGLQEAIESEVIGAIARFVDPSLRFEPKGHVSRSEFKESGLFRTDTDRYNGEDLFEGRIGSTDLRFSEVHAEYKTTTHTKNGSHTTWHTIFKGLFVVADFNKHFRGHTIVVPDVAERALGWLGQKLQDAFDLFRRGELVKLEDPEFEREFAVYGDDQVEARYILTPALMRRLLEFKLMTGKQCWFSFVGSNINIAIDTERDMFDVSLSRSLLDPQVVQEQLRDLQFVCGVVEDLDLNTRIWTKE
jgi:hypothetical protein